MSRVWTGRNPAQCEPNRAGAFWTPTTPLAGRVVLDGLEDPAGVGVLAEHGGLHQQRAGHGAADRSSLATLGGELADIEGVAEAYSVTGKWDFAAILRLRHPDRLAQVVTGTIAQLTGVVKTQTMVAFEVYSRHDLEALFSVGQ